jgi:predicted DsbA family dithiol-disulfide isomerase
MAKALQIDFVSDVVCPWCVIGLRELETALERLHDVVETDMHFQPFELNPAMPYEGQNIVEHISLKYGSAPEEMEARREQMKARAAGLGFRMTTNSKSRIYNSFDAHRLLHWAGLEGKQAALKHALFEAYFTEGLNIADHDVLAAKAAAVGLDADQARDVLNSGRYTDEVHAAEQAWQGAGITAVPAIVINRQYLISGGQPADVFEACLREIASKP